MAFHGVPEREVCVYPVLVAACVFFFPGTLDISAILEVIENSLDGTIGDSDAFGYILDAHGGVLGETNEHMRVIGQKGPRRDLRRDGGRGVGRRAGLAPLFR